MMLTVGASSPIKSVAELIRLAKQNPNSVTYASAGRGTGTHLAGALFSQMSGAPMLHVGYKGLVPGMTDVIGGRVTCMFPSIASGLPMVRAGKVRLLAVTGKKRFAILPQVPTVSEAGVRGFEVTSWYGLVAPSKTPRR
jgi:tripartite-type tricarboxylate transporter receptor subunit TctC